MKILFDHQTFVYQRFGGISRYIVELASGCNRIENTSAEISTVLSDNAYLKTFDRNNSISILNGKFPGSMTLYNNVNRFVTNYKIRQQSHDIFHPTYYDTYFLKAIGDNPFVITVHDMIHELYPGKWSNQEKIRKNKEVLIEKASHIISISEHTKKDLLHFYPSVSPSKVSVIWHGNSSFLNKEGRTKTDKNSGKKYFLFVGKRDEYKNFTFLIKTIAEYLKGNTDISLIAAGGGNATEMELKIISDSGLNQSINIIPFVTDAQLSELYQNAIALIFPSDYEGFGIPILEAFEAGCPLILNNASCFPEIAGEAALYFQKNDPNTLISAMYKARDDHEGISKLVQAGKERIKLFTWDITAKKTLDVYKAVNEDHGR